MIDFDHGFPGEIDSIIAAAILAFGFVYIHPFADGNGRLHRYLIHHVLTARRFNPTGIVFPISFAILERIDIQIMRLRRKIEEVPTDPQIIQSVRSVGYIFTAKVNWA